MIISLALALIAIASGLVLTYAYDENEPLAARLCSGACIGFALLGLIGLVLSLSLGLTAITLGLTAAILAAPLLLFTRERYRAGAGADLDNALRAISRATVRPCLWDFIYFLFYAGVAIAMWLIFLRALLEQPDGMFTGVLNNYGDLPFHLSVITRFAYGQNFPPEDPTFAGARFTYPFITDLISAMFLRAGASLRNSMFIENYIVGVALVGVVHRFGQRLLRNRTAAILTPLFVLLNGGFGWAMLFGDVNKTEGSVFQVLRHIPHSYTILPEIDRAWRWGNSVTTLLVTQRGFLLGIPLAVIVFTLWWTAMTDGEIRRQGDGQKRRENASSPSVPPSPLLPLTAQRMLAAGLIAGLVPLIHAHSFIVLMMVGAFLVPWIYRRAWTAYGIAAFLGGLIIFVTLKYGALNSPYIKAALLAVVIGLVANLFFFLPRVHLKLWLCFFVAAVVLALPQILWSTHHSAVKSQTFIAWQFGWDSDQETALGSKPVGTQPIDVAPPLDLWIKRTPYLAWFWLKNTGLFIPLLLVALIWKPDNYLVPRRLLLFYLPFTLCFLIPNVLKLAPWVWDNIKILFYWWIASAPIVALLLARLWEGSIWNRVLAASLFVMLTLAGALDIFPLLTFQGEYQEFDRDGITFAETIKQTTAPGAMILHAPIHNTSIYLTGRRSLMGYPGHIWTHGLDFGPREADIKRIYGGAPDAEALLGKYGVDYVVVSPQEHEVVSPNLDFFNRYPEVANIGEYHLYKVR
ncbi:MAG TPA: hypothetical protein VIU65_04815 [Pyrinomonadaceae bacterium]